MTVVQDRSVLLLATNKQEYLQFALNCADSVRLHNPDLPIFIATNLKVDDCTSRTDIKFLPVPEEIARLYLEAKLYLNDFLQSEETLFIDSDCLCYGDLTPIFEACRENDVTVVGRNIPIEGFWTGDGIKFARETLGINKSIFFNGGFYYIRNTPVAQQIFLKAREISDNYDAYGFHRIQNNWKNDEISFQIALAKYDQRPIPDSGSYMTDLFTDNRPVLNVLTGKRLLRNITHSTDRNRPQYPSAYSPIIIHFGGRNIRSYPYIAQSRLLKLYRNGVPANLSSIVVYFFIHIPYKSYHWLRNTIGNFKKTNG
ncbi:MAG: hypothetical protein JSU01_16100 [Bacteroidetes bacterium]|nr:hypothetical protein [Bacteroidota bacterium]